LLRPYIVNNSSRAGKVTTLKEANPGIGFLMVTELFIRGRKLAEVWNRPLVSN